MQSHAVAGKYIAATTRHVHTTPKVDHAQSQTKVDMALWCKALVLFEGLGGVEISRIPATNLDVVIGAAANRHIRIRRLGHA